MAFERGAGVGDLGHQRCFGDIQIGDAVAAAPESDVETGIVGFGDTFDGMGVTPVRQVVGGQIIAVADETVEERNHRSRRANGCDAPANDLLAVGGESAEVFCGCCH